MWTAALVAVLFILPMTPAGWSAAPATRDGETPRDTLLANAPDAAALGADVTDPHHEVSIRIVKPGREGLELSARLTDDGGVIARNIAWTIRNADGETVYDGDNAEPDVSVPPGDYAVEIRYGAARLASTVTLLETNRVAVSFVLNAGGLRVLPRVRDMGLPVSGSETRVFVLGGRDNGRLVAVSGIPGEVLRVPEGDYRVESRFPAGNARAVTDVHVNAGKMSALEIDHSAGIARLAFVGAPSSDVHWRIADAEGEPVAAANGLNADVVLVPGTYTASAKVGSEVLTATFDIASGQARDIILGN